ncbi:MAG: DNA-directed RNA polymerase subunit beta [Candidatus Brocadiia bacterium]
MEERNFAKIGSRLNVPDLTRIQRQSFDRFLQPDVPMEERESTGLQAVMEEVFPIENESKGVKVEFLGYSLGKPRYTPEECRQLKLTYGYPLHVRVRLHRGEEAVEESVYLGDMPIMLGGGEFIVNGAERIIVMQLHRSPGCDFSEEASGERTLYSCRIIPDRGSWVEMETNRYDILSCRLDQSGKIPVTLLLRAISEEHATDEDLIDAFYETETVEITPGTAAARLRERVSAETVEFEDGDVTMVSAGESITDEQAQQLAEAGVEELRVVEKSPDMLIINTMQDDDAGDHRQAVKQLYGHLRPGTPFNFEKAKEMLWEKFYDSNRYRLGEVGRFRMNRKFGQNIPLEHQTLRPEDLVEAIQYVIGLRAGEGTVDDIDHLGNRRVRTIGELAQDEIRKGFLKMRRTVEERLNLKDPDEFTPKSLINSKTVSSALNYFFGRSELSQIVDQTNPIAQLTHERRLSALGPGGLNRKRASFDVRDVHISHYGRICPIETPEGTNIGLITSLGTFAETDQFGFLVTPYRVMKDGELTDEVHYLRADEETGQYILPADKPIEEMDLDQEVLVRYQSDFTEVPLEEVDYADVSPKQIVGVSASLIPFLEHSDANRALMGSNMQRQAVPLLQTEAPLVGTGMEKDVARNSSLTVKSRKEGTVTYVDSERIVIDEEDEYPLTKFEALNQRTCYNQRPIVESGQKVEEGEIIADGPATANGELALGRNLLCAFMPWDGYNFEDAIVISEKMVKDDAYTSVHIESFETEIRETKLGKEEFTRDIPNVSEEQLGNLDSHGIIREGTWVESGDILVGKVSPKSRSELSPEEKLLYAIFGKAGEDVRNESMTVPSGTDGVVVHTERFSRRSALTDEERLEVDDRIEELEAEYNEKIAGQFRQALEVLEKVLGGPVVDASTQQVIDLEEGLGTTDIAEMAEEFSLNDVEISGERLRKKARAAFEPFAQKVQELCTERDSRTTRLSKGDELPSGVLEMVRVYVATKRKMGVGDKMAGRHGNKGVVAKIVPEEDMPFLDDGTPVEVVLNPLGVPSRMNVGQILETHLSWAAKTLGFEAITPVFDGASEEEIRDYLREAGLPEDGKATVYDGRTGEAFDQGVTVGYMYMMKLDHLVDDKVHARATGPYSLITQQPLGGKARYGGQRFGEMEVWAVEAYGAAHVLQELLTVKSDDVDGRTKIYESMVKGTNVLEAGIPVAFEVLANEIRGLGLNLRLEKESF